MLSTWLQRYLTAVIVGLGALLLAAFVLIGVLFAQLAEARDDLERVEGGAALVTAQVQALRSSLEASEPAMSARLDEAIAGLEAFGNSTLEFDVQVDQSVDIETELVVDREIIVPIQATLPIDQTFETTIEVEGPLGIVVPVDVTVPVNLDVPIDLEVTVPVRETIPLDASVPLRASVPLAVEVADTELATLAEALIDGLSAFRDLFGDLSR